MRTESRTKRTDPSHIRTFTPWGWAEGRRPPPPPPPPPVARPPLAAQAVGIDRPADREGLAGRRRGRAGRGEQVGPVGGLGVIEVADAALGEGGRVARPVLDVGERQPDRVEREQAVGLLLGPEDVVAVIAGVGVPAK